MFSGEIGLRQLSDWAMLMANTVGYNRELLISIGLAVFADTLNAVCKEEFCIFLLEQVNCDRILVIATVNKLMTGGNLRGTIEQSISHSFAKASPGDDKGCNSNILARYVSNIKDKVKREYPQFGYIILLPIFCLFYPIRWWIRVLTGKRKCVSPVHVLCMASREKTLYDALRIYE